MPIETKIWKINGKRLDPLDYSSIESEKFLEGLLINGMGIIDPNLMLISQQVPTEFGTFIDLLAVDSDGDLTVIELKKKKTPREVVSQLLDYASWVQNLSNEEVRELFGKYNPDKNFDTSFNENFGTNPPESINENQNLLIVCTELDNSTERIIGFLSDRYGVPINAIFFRHFNDKQNEFLTRTWLIDPNIVEAKASSKHGEKEPWNGRDFYVSFGESDHRNWDDAIQYGFISGGQGEWFSRSLGQLTIGSRVFVHIPKFGYIGVGNVTDTVKSVNDFKVEINGDLKPILDLPLRAKKMGENKNDPEKSEYLVKVEWTKTVKQKDAYWTTGLFANQNTACKLRNKFTLEKLIKYFDLQE